MRAVRRTASAVAATALIVAGLSGCLGKDDSGSRGGGAATGGGAVQGGVTVASADKPVAKATFPSPIASGATVDLAVLGLKAGGRLADLSISMTPHVPNGATQRITPYLLNGGTPLGVFLIDNVNLKRYLVVKDSSGHDLQTDYVTTNIANDQPGQLSFTFAAPPKGVDRIDVQIGNWPIFHDVPIAR
ncbi:hypothetical protein GCM10023195_13330 [Actinoallomurus liliacearum]|uniref:Lipoprotein n=1 Tax=Actinoallomurus liliacearum TaxID=1080073 RepID=A0ABP8TFE2_9ACTN